MIMLANDVALKLQEWGIGVYTPADPSDCTLFVGDFPVIPDEEDGDLPTEGVVLVATPSPPPHQYIDTEYPVIDIWSFSPHTDRAYDLLYRTFEALHRRADWSTDNYLVYFSQALGNITDADRDAMGGKMFRLSVQFICRNLNHIS